MIKINNPVALFGALMIEYRGNNEILLNSPKRHYVESFKLISTCTLHDGTIERACFKVNIYGVDLLIALDGGEVYQIETSGDLVYYVRLTESCIDSVRSFKGGNKFIVTTSLYYSQIISEYDHRNEQFFFTLIFKNTPEINNLFN